VSYRKEKKYRVTRAEYQQLKNAWLSSGMVPLHNTRQVSSIYFDNNEYGMYHHSEEGVLPRKKIRIRWYNDNQEFALEKKISSIEGRFKTSAILGNIICVDTALKQRPIDQHYGVLLPSLIVSYERTYFSMNGMRITFDADIKYQNLRQNNMLIQKDPEQVIEIKVPIEISDNFIEKIVPYPTARFSKYCRGLLISERQLSEV